MIHFLQYIKAYSDDLYLVLVLVDCVFQGIDLFHLDYQRGHRDVNIFLYHPFNVLGSNCDDLILVISFLIIVVCTFSLFFL